MFTRLREDIRAITERDPAVKSAIEALLCYPGLHALSWHRLAHGLYKRRIFVLSRLVSQFSRFLTGTEIHPGAVIGRGVFIDHGMGVVIGETAIVGDGVTIYQGVTLGGTGKERGKRHPTIGNGVLLSAGARVLGNVTIGARSKIGAGAVVVKDVPADCTVVGVPGRVVKRCGERINTPAALLEQIDLPDPLGEALQNALSRIERLENTVQSLEAELQAKEGEHVGADKTA